MSFIDTKRPIVVKVIMTQAFRKQLIEEARETIKQIDDNLEHMEKSQKREIMQLEISNPQKASMATQQMESDKERLVKMRDELDWRIKEVEKVEDGAELPFRVFEGSVQLKVGDMFLDKISKAEVVIKDWKIVEIRNA